MDIEFPRDWVIGRLAMTRFVTTFAGLSVCGVHFSNLSANNDPLTNPVGASVAEYGPPVSCL